MEIQFTAESVAMKIKKSFNFLRKRKREISRLKDYNKYDIKNTEHYEILSKFQKFGCVIPTYIDNTTNVESVIFNCKRILEKEFPDIYKIISCNKSNLGDVITNFYSGDKKTYVKIYMVDILESDAGKECTPFELLILFDMFRHLNFKSQKIINIQKTGFTYTYFDCKLSVSEDTFKRAIPRLVERGFFELITRTNGHPNVYRPSSNWRTYKSNKIHKIKKIN